MKLRTERQAAFLRLSRARKREWPDDTRKWVDSHLHDTDWEIRNVAVKLAGMGRMTEYTDELVQFLENRSQPGFIRRNSAAALREIGACEPGVFLAGLDDPYWEVRTESAFGLQCCGSPDPHLARTLIAKLYRKPPDRLSGYPLLRPSRIYREKNFEVRSALLHALGTAATSEADLRAIEIPMQDDIWKVRVAALEAFVSAAGRLGLDQERMASVMSSIDLTCTEFIPTFPIRETYNTLAKISMTPSKSEPIRNQDNAL
ncbi:hypothetical protein JXA80_07340 [bacterium]|nr:hypothetical protein [candidate division CSSED10-310 bacterium]